MQVHDTLSAGYKRSALVPAFGDCSSDLGLCEMFPLLIDVGLMTWLWSVDIKQIRWRAEGYLAQHEWDSNRTIHIDVIIVSLLYTVLAIN